MTTKVIDYWPVRGLLNRQDPEEVMWQAYEKALSCKTWGELRRVCNEDGLYMPRPDERTLERLNARQPGCAFDIDVHRSKNFRCAQAQVGEVLLLAAWNVVEPGGYEDWQENQRYDLAARLRRLEEAGGGTVPDRLGVSWEDPGNYIAGRWARQFDAAYKAGRVERSEEVCAAVSVRRPQASGERWPALVQEVVCSQLVPGDQES